MGHGIVIPIHIINDNIRILSQISKKKRKAMYKSKSCSEFDKAEMILYEEVTKMPPFRRKTLVLVGVQGVGRRTLKSRLLNSDPNKFGTIIPRKRRSDNYLVIGIFC